MNRLLCMNKKISTRVGIITALSILAFMLFVMKSQSVLSPSFQLFQFLILFAGVMVSCFLLYKYYAGISFMDGFTHGLKTVATTLTLLIIGSCLLFLFLSAKTEPLSGMTFMIMRIIFSYSLSGVLSAALCSFIFNTFTKK